jgi:SAM-dependent methyltransferase
VTTPASYFEGMYAASPDPWSFASRWYEERKRAHAMAALPRPRYRRGFEPGCATGLLTEQLAQRSDALLAADAVDAAVRTAADRMAGDDHVRVERLRVPQQWPAGRFDLIVLSELAYYFDDGTLDLLLDRVAGSLEAGGTLLAVHWRYPVAEHVRSGDAVHDVLAARIEWQRTVRHEEDDFLLEVYVRVPPPACSVAQTEGLC